MPALTGYHYKPMPLDRKPAGKAPFAYMKTTQPSSWKVGGKSVSPGQTSGGSMNGGGKRRPGTRTVK